MSKISLLLQIQGFDEIGPANCIESRLICGQLGAATLRKGEIKHIALRAVVTDSLSFTLN